MFLFDEVVVLGEDWDPWVSVEVNEGELGVLVSLTREGYPPVDVDMAKDGHAGRLLIESYVIDYLEGQELIAAITNVLQGLFRLTRAGLFRSQLKLVIPAGSREVEVRRVEYGSDLSDWEVAKLKS